MFSDEKKSQAIADRWLSHAMLCFFLGGGHLALQEMDPTSSKGISARDLAQWKGEILKFD